MDVEDSPADVFSTSRSRLINNGSADSSVYNSQLGSYQWGSLEDFKQFNKKWESLEDFQQFTQGMNTSSSQLNVEQTDTDTEDGYSTVMYCTQNNNGVVNGAYSFDGTLPVRGVQDFDIIDVTLDIDMREKRFGFSVMGGSDEGFQPRIDNIAKGSPADRAELEIWDEILEVNGELVEEYTHADIIALIHKSIKSRSINLRVRRKKSKSQPNGPSFDKVQDAYMIAVEDEAKERLERLSKLHTITPLDMTKLAIDNSSNNSEENLVETNPIYESSMPVNSKGHHIGNGHVELSDMNGFMEKEVTKSGKSDKGRRENKHGKSKSNSSAESPIIENVLGPNSRSQNSLNHSYDDLQYQDGEFSDAYTTGSFELEGTGPHREMAIDCPESFPGTVKSPPRLPSHTPRAPPSTPYKSLDQGQDRERTDNTLSTAASVMSNGQQHQPLREDQLERLRKHQEELRKRREEESRIAREQEFLRTSLRGSKKLQALESKKQSPEGVINTAFVENDDEFDNLDDGFGSTRAPSERDRYMKKNVAVEDLFACLQHVRSKLNAAEERDEVAFLKNLFQNSQFQQAVNIHNKVVGVTSLCPPPRPVCTDATEMSSSIIADLEEARSPYASDLVEILSKPGFKNLLRAHDLVADNELKPISNLPDDEFMDFPMMDAAGDSVKIVHLEKTSEPLGATVRNDGDSVIIGRIVKGGTAEKSGLLHEGDEILDVNGIDMKGKNINDVSDMLANMTGTITFMIVPANSFTPKPVEDESKVMHVKALFNYDPLEDNFIPCRELGISFMKGDLLHVINMDDANWWQAYREGEQEHHSLAGLVPSRNFQEQREASKKSLSDESREKSKKSRTCTCGRRERKRKKKMYKDLEDDEDILTYEEMEYYYPQPNRKRPIVLIGPPNVGRHELRQRLMESDYDRFAAAVPHTSRAMQGQEIDKKDYHFVSRVQFESDIASGKFVEHGEFEKNLYGTSLEAVRQVITQGKICILNLHPESLQMLKNSDLKPYIVFIYPQNMEKLRQIQTSIGMTTITDEDLKEIIERAREMEDKYGHFFDYILVNSNMDNAYEELLTEINRLEVEPQWVPAVWSEG